MCVWGVCVKRTVVLSGRARLFQVKFTLASEKCFELQFIWACTFLCLVKCVVTTRYYH